VQHQWLRVEAKMGAIGADHPQRLDARRQPRQIADLDGLQMMGMDGATLRRHGQCFAAALALALQKPTRLAGRVDLAVGFLPKRFTLTMHGDFFRCSPDRQCIKIVIRL
jgi:hypothetical protein